VLTSARFLRLKKAGPTLLLLLLAATPVRPRKKKSLRIKGVSENRGIDFYINYIYPNIRVKTSIKTKYILSSEERQRNTSNIAVNN
jgi:hypothetical protein